MLQICETPRRASPATAGADVVVADRSDENASANDEPAVSEPDRVGPVTARNATRLAVAMGAVALVLFVAGQVLTTPVADRENGGSWIVTAEFLAILVASSGMGALIVAHQPRNAVGWILVAAGFATGLTSFSHGYAEQAIAASGGPDLLGRSAALYGDLSWMPLVIPYLTFLLLLFPNGRLLSRRWRIVAWCAGLGFTISLAGAVLTPGHLSDYPTIRNPYGVKGLGDPLQGLGALLLLVAVIGSPWSLVLRFRRAEREERQQIKWLALAGATAAVTLLLALPLYDVSEAAANIAILLSVLALPVATGIAVLRYRLYDIDVVINRALVYTALTAILAATYLGSVLLLQLALESLTAGSNLAVAASTLAVAALFRPARARIQQTVDHRFFRRKYDAARTLEAFSARLRDEVSLDALSVELRDVVAETVQPAHVSLWLREVVR